MTYDEIWLDMIWYVRYDYKLYLLDTIWAKFINFTLFVFVLALLLVRLVYVPLKYLKNK